MRTEGVGVVNGGLRKRTILIVCASDVIETVAQIRVYTHNSGSLVGSVSAMCLGLVGVRA